MTGERLRPVPLRITAPLPIKFALVLNVADPEKVPSLNGQKRTRTFWLSPLAKENGVPEMISKGPVLPIVPEAVGVPCTCWIINWSSEHEPASASGKARLGPKATVGGIVTGKMT